jgi:hypothetical protein
MLTGRQMTIGGRCLIEREDTVDGGSDAGNLDEADRLLRQTKHFVLPFRFRPIIDRRRSAERAGDHLVA